MENQAAAGVPRKLVRQSDNPIHLNLDFEPNASSISCKVCNASASQVPAHQMPRSGEFRLDAIEATNLVHDVLVDRIL